MRGGVKSDTLPLSEDKQKKKRKLNNKFQSNLYDKCKMMFMFILFALIWNEIPVTANVSDNLQSAAVSILGTVDANVGNSYENATTNAKINYLEEEIQELQKLVIDLKTVIETSDMK